MQIPRLEGLGPKGTHSHVLSQAVLAPGLTTLGSPNGLSESQTIYDTFSMNNFQK